MSTPVPASHILRKTSIGRSVVVVVPLELKSNPQLFLTSAFLRLGSQTVRLVEATGLVFGVFTGVATGLVFGVFAGVAVGSAAGTGHAHQITTNDRSRTRIKATMYPGLGEAAWAAGSAAALFMA